MKEMLYMKFVKLTAVNMVFIDSLLFICFFSNYCSRVRIYLFTETIECNTNSNSEFYFILCDH